MTSKFRLVAAMIACSVIGLFATSPPAAAVGTEICVYDPGGRSGSAFKLMQDLATEAATWGAEVSLKPYTDEETAAKDYEAGACAGVVATGVRLQRFNRFPSTIEAVGALPTYDLLQGMVNTLAQYESAAAKLTSGEHQTVGFIPVGAVYLFVRDRQIDTVGELAGKRIATLDYDKPSVTMVNRVGAIMVPADLGSVGPKFNNGDVDACYASAPMYQPFELFRGLQPNGGIVRLPLAQATLQVMIRSESFPSGFGKQARTYLASRFDDAIAEVQQAEAAIPSAMWIDIDAAAVPGFEQMFQAVRIKLRDEVGAYDPSMLSAMRKLRCKKDPARGECAEQVE